MIAIFKKQKQKKKKNEKQIQSIKKFELAVRTLQNAKVF